MNDILIMDIDGANGVPFRVLYIPRGVSCPHCADSFFDAEARVEFYDRRYDFTPNGQFISNYFAFDIVDKPVGGMNLYGNVPDWTIDTRTAFVVWQWVSAREALVKS